LEVVTESSGANFILVQIGLGIVISGVERPDHEADHSPPSIAEVKNEWRYRSTTSIRLNGKR